MNESIDPEKVALGAFVLDRPLCELRTADGQHVSLGRRAFDVLSHLASQPHRLFTKDELLHAVWAPAVVTEDSLVQCIGELRRVLDDGEHRLIRTEAGRGYRLVPTPHARALPEPPELPTEAPFKQEIRYATTTDGVNIAYACSGEGPPLVRTGQWLTHLDWDWRSDVFGPRIRALSRSFRFWRYDTRGCGLSDRHVPQASLDESVADIEAVVDAAGLQRFALLGTSGGGAIAVRYAARHPERVSRLVLLAGFVRGTLRRGELSQSQATADAFAQLIEQGWGQDNAAFRQLMTSQLWPGASLAQMQSFNHLQLMACTPAGAADLIRKLSVVDASPDLPQVRCPTLVLHNPHDPRVPFDEARFIAARIPDARLEPFDGRNHTPLPDEPAFEQVIEAIVGFASGPDAAIPIPLRATLRSVPSR